LPQILSLSFFQLLVVFKFSLFFPLPSPLLSFTKEEMEEKKKKEPTKTRNKIET
jgi:hypothetical protein